MRKTSNSQQEVRAIFREVCNRREQLVFVTPYLRFESNFVGLDNDQIHVRATMSRDYALYGLQVAELSLRFPYKMRFMEASAKLLGYGEHKGDRTIRFAMPEAVYENDERKSFRVERVGKVTVTLSTPHNQLLQAGLNNISATGALLMAKDDLSSNTLKVNDKVMLFIPLTEGITISSSAIVRHIQNRAFGVEYNPGLPDSVLDPFSRWIFMKREEEREFSARQPDAGPTATTESAKRERGPNEGGILLFTYDAEIGLALNKLLGENRKFYCLPPDSISAQDTLSKRPHLVILHMADGGMEERYLIKTLVEMIKGDAPVILLGTNVDKELLFEVGQEWKVASSIIWAPARSVFLQRLVLGMLRNYYGQGESPMAPTES